MKKLLIAAFTLVFTTAVFAADVTVEAYGEAEIINNDLAAAKIIAENRAKWDAIEKAADVKVSASSVVHNQGLLDEAVKYDIKGSVTKYTKTDEGKDGNVYWVTAKVTVSPDKATNVVDKLAKNTTIAVILPLTLPDGTVEIFHAFSEAIANDLMKEGFEVIDLAYSYPELVDKLSAAVQKNDMLKVSALASQVMADTVLVGSLKAEDKGNDVGYTKVKFSIVDGNLNYKVIGNNNGKKSLLFSGSEVGRGQGKTPALAATNVSSNMAKRNSAQIAGTVAQKVFDLNKTTVRVVLSGNTDVKKLQSFKDELQYMSWVLDITERGTDTLIVNYGEKPYYLAAMINGKGYKIKQFSDTEITVSY